MAPSPVDNDLWFRRFHPSPVAPRRLVCFPHAGGSAAFYRPLSASLSPQVDVLCLRYPGGRDRRSEPGVESVGVLADEIYEVLGGWADTPLTFFGHGVGALLAFEVARRFERVCAEPVHLFASGSRAPYEVRGESYRCEPGASVYCPVTALVGDSDPGTSPDEARAWEEHTTGAFDLKVLPGGHLYPDRWPAEVMAVLQDHFAADLVPRRV
ncbi:thioesterase II family protein [Streptacidiphilus carbonis]|uniref:thioesterase II family protein n=1 Tax=Streptacidiphilus carbonis TaxID=105422 RepID=UPI0005A79F4D|nr:thioesterase domain-containing protein [Streptacidiphilus carbonis]